MDSDHYWSNGYAWVDSGLFVLRRKAAFSWTIDGSYNCVIMSRSKDYYLKTTGCDTLAGYVCRKDPYGEHLRSVELIYYWKYLSKIL